MRFSPRLAIVLLAAVIGGALVLAAAPASAQTFGVRVGASARPSQFVFGGHVETPPLADHLYFRPNVEVGIGDNVTLVTANFEVVYKFELAKPWGLYGGAGPALNVISDVGRHAEGGFNFLAGVEHESGIFAEVKAGIIDSPRFKVTLGYVFRK
jgi:hypothetical protein